MYCLEGASHQARICLEEEDLHGLSIMKETLR